MGNGIAKKCPKCGQEELVFFGLGFAYPAECKENIDKAFSGDLGPEIERLIREEPAAKVEAKYFLYQCPECRDWVNEQSLDVFYPKEEYKKDDNIEPWEDEKFFLKRENERYCLKCNKKMKKYKSIGNLKLKCQKCHASMVSSKENILWD